jgi:hypothetical protein
MRAGEDDRASGRGARMAAMRSRSGINRRLVVGAVAGAYVCCGIAGIVLESVEVFGATVGAVSAIVSIWAVDLAMRASESGQTTNTPQRRPSNNPGYSRASLTASMFAIGWRRQRRWRPLRRG